MKTLITLSTVLIFLFLVIKRKLSKLGITGRKEPFGKPVQPDGDKEKGTEKIKYPAPLLPSSDNCEACDGFSRHEVHLFNFAECDSGTYFAGLIEAKLSVIEAEMREKGYPYKLRYLVLNNAIVCIVEYRLRNAPASVPEADP